MCFVILMTEVKEIREQLSALEKQGVEIVAEVIKRDLQIRTDVKFLTCASHITERLAYFEDIFREVVRKDEELSYGVSPNTPDKKRNVILNKVLFSREEQMIPGKKGHYNVNLDQYLDMFNSTNQQRG